MPVPGIAAADFAGHVTLVNVWASWCVSCRQEHPVLMQFARDNVVPLVGLNYKDTRPEALGWLKEHGDPYTVSVVDADGRVGIDFGVYGVPETFLIDREGVVRYKHIGPVTPEAVRDVLLPKIAELSRAS